MYVQLMMILVIVSVFYLINFNNKFARPVPVRLVCLILKTNFAGFTTVTIAVVGAALLIKSSRGVHFDFGVGNEVLLFM